MKYTFPLTIMFLIKSLFGYSQTGFVRTDGHHFIINEKPYYYVGANYWYGGLEGNTAKGKLRIKKELDFLVSKGVTNLRVLGGAEGEGPIMGLKYRVQPALQPRAGEFDTATLAGLDFLLTEMGRRNMKAVIYLSNNWEWSGGFLQYLQWNDSITKAQLIAKTNWDLQRDYTSKFYSCTNCIQQYRAQVQLIVNRINSITHKSYKEDTAIMAWELANEPRPMRTTALEGYKDWVKGSAEFIKGLDKNHLVTTGSEGVIGSEHINVFKGVHSDKNIDYLTIHIWPKNWSWFRDTAIAASLDSVKLNTANYIKTHDSLAMEMKKPLVIEEFGLPRDRHSFSLKSSTRLRDNYYEFVLQQLALSKQTNGTIAGVNFWAFSGAGRPSKNGLFWKPGADRLGDPPQEEQGLNSVFDSDKTTWKVIEEITKGVNH